MFSMLFHTTSKYSALRHVVLCCSILFLDIPCYSIPCHTMLFHSFRDAPVHVALFQVFHTVPAIL